MKVYVLGALTLLTACGDDKQLPPDAGPCWPLKSVPGGQVELGTGDLTFMPMPAMLSIVRDGTQSDPFLRVQSRIRGMPPGNSRDFLDPSNPKTKIGLVIDALVIDGLPFSVALECPASVGYVPSPEAGAFDMVRSLRLGFGPTMLDQIDGKSARITIEVVGSNGLYATDEKTVVLSAPPLMTTP